MKLHLIFWLTLVCYAGRTSGVLDSDVDSWLADWYSPRIQVRTGLGGLAISWSEGYLWWRKDRILLCSSGQLDFSKTVFSRIGEPGVQPRVNSSRPLVTVGLAFQNGTSGRFAFYNCSLDNGVATTNGSVSGDITPNSDQPSFKIVFTYKSAYWWCQLKTVGAGPISGRLSISNLELEGLEDIPEDVRGQLENTVLSLVLQSVVTNWASLADDGPKCPDTYCKLKAL